MKKLFRALVRISIILLLLLIIIGAILCMIPGYRQRLVRFYQLQTMKYREINVPRIPEEAVFDWQVSAKGIFHKEKSAIFGMTDGASHNLNDTNLTPAIQVHSLVVMKKGLVEKPWFWPDATMVELLRSTKRDSGYESVMKLSWLDMKKLLAWPEGSHPRNRQPILTYSLYLRDDGVEPWERYYYKVRFVDKWGKTMRESGFCSAISTGTLDSTMTTDANGFTTISWPDIQAGSGEALADPHILVSERTTCFAQFPLKKGSFTFPYKLPFPTAEIEIVFEYPRDIWSMTLGQKKEVNIRDKNISAVKDKEKIRENISRRRKMVADKRINRRNGPANKRVGNTFVNENFRRWRNSISLNPSKSGDAIALHVPYDYYKKLAINPPKSVPDRFDGIKTSLQLPEDWSGLRSFISPGYPRHYAYSFSWNDEEGENISGQASAARPPMPNGLWAVAGDKEVKLSWNPLKWNPKDWETPPVIVLRRFARSDIVVDSGKFNFIMPGEEIFRGPLDCQGYTDRNVKNGEIYFYNLEVHGVLRAKGWHGDCGAFACLIPLKIPMWPGYSGYPVIAEPSLPRPLFATFLTQPNAPPEERSLKSYLMTNLGDVSWIQILERQKAHFLFDEKSLASLSENGFAFKANPILDDIIVRIKSRGRGAAAKCDIWVEDFKNSHKERVVSMPRDHLNLKKAKEELLKYLSEKYANYSQYQPELKKSNLRRLNIAILDFKPVKGESPGDQADKISALLAVSVGESDDFRVVERENIDSAVREMSFSKLNASSCLQLGKLLLADYIVSGFYQIKDDEIIVFPWIIEPKTGLIVKQGAIKKKLENIDDIGDEMIKRLRNIRYSLIHDKKTCEVLQLLDSEASNNNSGQYQFTGSSRKFTPRGMKMNEAKKVAYISPTATKAYLEMGNQYLKKGQKEEALNAFLTGLRYSKEEAQKVNIHQKDRQTHKLQYNPSVFYGSATRLLHSLGRYEEEVNLLKEQLDYVKERRGNIDVILLSIADAYILMKQYDKALETLGKVSKHSYKCGRRFESIGRQDEAMDHYLGSLSKDRYGISPSYAAFVRIIRQCGQEERLRYLEKFIKTSCNSPHQVLIAAKELFKHGHLDKFIKYNAALAAFRIGKFDEGASLFQNLIESYPNTREGINAIGEMGEFLYDSNSGEAAATMLNMLDNLNVDGELAKLAELQKEKLTYLFSKPPTELKRTLSIKKYNDILNKLRPKNNRVFFRDGKGYAYCYDIEKQDVIWSLLINKNESICESSRNTRTQKKLDTHNQYTMLTEGIVIFSDFLGGSLHAVDSETGESVWRYADWLPISQPLIIGGNVLVANAFGDVMELSLSSGRVLRKWRNDAYRESYRHHASPKLTKLTDAILSVNNGLHLFSSYNNGAFRPFEFNVNDFKKLNLSSNSSLDANHGLNGVHNPKKRSSVAPPSVRKSMTVQNQTIDVKKPPATSSQKTFKELSNKNPERHSGDVKIARKISAMPERKKFSILVDALDKFRQKQWLTINKIDDKALLVKKRKECERDLRRKVLGVREILRSADQKSSIPFLIESLPQLDNPCFINNPRRFLGGQYQRYYYNRKKSFIRDDVRRTVHALENLSGQAFGLNKGAWEIWWKQSDESVNESTRMNSGARRGQDTEMR